MDERDQAAADAAWIAKYMAGPMLPDPYLVTGRATWDSENADPLADMRNFIAYERANRGRPIEPRPTPVHPDVHAAIRGLSAGPVIIDEAVAHSDPFFDWRAVPVLPRKSLLTLCLEAL